MTDENKASDSFDPFIPVLTDVLIPGKPEHTRAASASEIDAHDAKRITQRLQERIAGFLDGEARTVIEARCEEVLREHSTKLVREITQEVTLALEGSMRQWVKVAVEDALRREREA
jgi:hypothetical protein